MRNVYPYSRHFAALTFLLFAITTYAQPPVPASLTAAIGAPANGAAHYISLSWATSAGATSYELENSPDGSTWANVYTGSATTYSHNTGPIGNKANYYRVRAVASSLASAYRNATQYPIYSACDAPSLPSLFNAGPNTMQLALIPETPDANPATTTYSIYCPTAAKYVQANGTLNTTEVFQTMALWDTITLTGLTASTNYCFYAKARNNDGDIRTATGNTITAAEPFTTNSNFSTQSGSGPTNMFWSPSSCTTGGLTYSSSGGCTGGYVGKTGSFNNYFGCFLRTPQQNFTGNSSVVMNFDISNSYFSNHTNDKTRFYMWIDNQYKNANSVKINGVEVGFTDVNGMWLKFDQARSCVNVSVTFDLSTSTNLSNILFYIEPNCGYNDASVFSVAIDNVSFQQGVGTACLSTTACTAPTITGNPQSQSICLGDTGTFSITTSGAVASYQWQVSTNGGGSWTNITNGGVYSGATTNALTLSGVTLSMNSYQYKCTVTGSCTGAPVSTAAVLTVSNVPGTAGSITGPTTVCPNQQGVSYSVGLVSGATTYTWWLPTGATIASGLGTNSITVNFGNANGGIMVTPVNSCGAGTSSPIKNITMGSVPSAAGSISGTATVCANQTGVTYSVATVANATSYNWSLPQGAVISLGAGTNSITVNFTNTPGGTITVTPVNGCGNGTSSPAFTVSLSGGPATPAAITGNTAVCAGSNQQYVADTVAGATFYTWTLPSQWTGTSTTNAINVTVPVSGIIQVVANSSCGSSQPQSLLVNTLTAPSTPGAISGNNNVCAGSSQTFSISSVPTATGYNWSLPSGWSGASTDTSITVTANANGGTLSVSAVNQCGNASSNSDLSITVLSAPSTPAAITGSTTVCQGSDNLYVVSPVANATSYNWSYPNGWAGSANGDSVYAMASATSGAVAVSAVNACGSSTAQSLSVTVNALPQVSYSFPVAEICSLAQPVVLSGGTPTGGTYGGVAIVAGSFYPAIAGIGSHQLTYSYTDNNGCTAVDTATVAVVSCTGFSEAANYAISVYPNPFSRQIVIQGGNELIGAQLTLTDLTGKCISNTLVNETTTTLLLSSALPQGIYLLHIRLTDGSTAVYKLSKQQ